MSFQVASAILRGRWLLNQQWAIAHLPMVAKSLKGETVDFGIPALKKQITLISAPGNPTQIYSAYPNNDLSGIQPGSIAVVELSGPMIKYGGACTYGMVDQAALISQLGNQKNISGIILNIDSPGGQADGTALLATAIREAAAKKPVIAIINDGMAASAAMWIASAANEIYAAQPTDQFGSIGVYTTIADWVSYYEAQGLKIQDVYAPQSTDKNKPYLDAVNGNDALLKEDLSILADQFINTIAANRTGKIKGDTWKTGKLFYAAAAKKIGLIDGIKTFSQVVERIIKINSTSQKNNANIMAFQKTLTVAKATDFSVNDEGFLLSEEHLNNIEAGLATIEAAGETVIALSVAIENITGLGETINTLTSERDQAILVNTKNITIIQTLTDKIAFLGGQPSGKGTVLGGIKTDTTTEEEKELPSYLDPNNPSNQYADKRVRKTK